MASYPTGVLCTVRFRANGQTWSRRNPTTGVTAALRAFLAVWLSDERGSFTDWTTQQWVKITGRRISIADTPWLDGPTGKPTGIGGAFFDEWAAEQGRGIERHHEPRGLLPDFDRLAGPDFDPKSIHPDVRRFYEQTSGYEVETWSEWCGVFKPFGGLLALMFSRRLQQLNVPLAPLDTSAGTESEVVHIVDRNTNEVQMAAWVRHLKRTGNVLYAGSYSVTDVPGHTSPCVRVVFPLPRGNAIVLLKPLVDTDGGLTVASWGRAWGDPGFYFTVHRPGPSVWARYVRTMRETIRVYGAGDGEVRADHTMWLWGLVFLRLHYRLRPTDKGHAA